MGVLVAGIFGYGMFIRASIMQANEDLLRDGAVSGKSNAEIYYLCSQQSACSAWLIDALRGEFSPFWTGVLGLGLVGLVIGVAPVPNLGVYTGGFARLRQLAKLRINDWHRDPVAGCSLLVGYHLPLPESGVKRERVLMGEDFSELDTKLLAVQPGYGKRPELGHMATFGMTRSGKSVHLMTQIARWSRSFVVLDVKGEIYHRTAGLKSKSMQIFVLSPTGIGYRFDALSEVIKSSNGYATAAEIIAAPHLDREPAFAQRAASGIEAALRVAVIKGEAPIPFLRKLTVAGGITAFLRELKSVDDESVRTALNTFLGISGGDDFDVDKAMNDRYLMSSWGNMMQRLKPFMQEEVQHLFSGSDFSAESLVKRPVGVYLMWPEETLEATSAVYNLVVLGIMRGIVRYADKHFKGRQPPVPVLFGLDEAKKAPLMHLDDHLSTAASRGISMLLYLQSPSQFDGLYGKNRTEAILSNCATQLYYKVEELSTAEYISRRCGKKSVATESRSRKRTLMSGVPTISESTTGREVITTDEVFNMGGEDRQCVIAFISGKRPILAKRLNYYEHGWLNDLLKAYSAPPIPVPQSSSLPKASSEAEAVTPEPEAATPEPEGQDTVYWEPDASDKPEALRLDRPPSD